MRKSTKKYVVMFLTALLIMMNAMPAFAAAAETNSAGGYFVPAAITLQVGEKKTLKVEKQKKSL